jgi:hypothetical protein
MEPPRIPGRFRPRSIGTYWLLISEDDVDGICVIGCALPAVEDAGRASGERFEGMLR